MPAGRVAAGILVTRLLGFVRERVFAHYFGNTPAAGAFRAALRIPNAIRNLLGEGTLSASFIPVYAGMIARGETENARRLSGVIVSLLTLVTAIAALLGMVLAPVITDLVAPGFAGETRALTVTLVQIMFPMAGVLILSAWCLGVLNTHRRFFLSYAAPSAWNIAQIAALVGAGGVLAGARLAVALAVGAVVGSALQLLVQLPSTLRLAGSIRWGIQFDAPGVRTVVRAWLPVIVGAGVLQISSIVETQLASFLGADAVAVLGYAQLLALLPVALFGVSVAAAALPELSRDAAVADAGVLQRRLTDGARRVAFFVIPSAFGLTALGGPIVATLFETGQFGPDDTALVAGVLAAYAIGLPAQASVKLFASGFYAIGDTRTPVRYAVVSVVLGAGLAALFMQRFGPAGIALGAALAAYVNVGLLTVSLGRRIGPLMGPTERRALLVTAVGALAGTASGVGVARALAAVPVWATTVTAVAGFGLVYMAVTMALRHPDAMGLLRR